MSITKKQFSPTYLIIKRHKITGLKYFCKTCKKDPILYCGSGKYWKTHIKKHGKEYVETIWFHLFDEKERCVNFAITFSEVFDIVESELWANLKPENGLDGGVYGLKDEKSSQRMKLNNPMKILKTNSGSFKHGRKYIQSEKHKHNIKLCKLGNKNPNFNNKLASKHLNEEKYKCNVCGIITNKGNIFRWHNEKCKHGNNF